jgi:hypothetical protein
MKCLQLFLLIILISTGELTVAQSASPNLKLSIQTDLLAYTTAGGWSAWLTAQYHQNRLSLAFVNYPNRFRSIYDETGIKEIDRFARLQLSRNFKPTSRLKNFHYGMNVEYHWRQLEEDNNVEEILNDTNWRLGAFIGYDWQPFSNKENALNNLSIIPWIGINARPNNRTEVRVFENTGSIYPIPSFFGAALGLNISYTFYKY